MAFMAGPQAILVGILAGALPLVTRSGRNLEYEHVTMAASMVAVFWPMAVICFGSSPRRYSLADWMVTVGALFFGLALPGVLMFAARLCPCSELGYGQWLLVQALPSCILAASAGTIARHFMDKSDATSSKRRLSHQKIKYILIWIAVILASLASLSATLWLMPQKRAVHWLFGFLHGPIYDERIWLHRDIILARIGQACIFAAAGLAFYQNFLRRLLIAGLGLAWAIITILTVNSAVTGHGSTILQRQFPQTLIRPGFRLFHFMTNSDDASRLAAEAAFHIQDLKIILGPLDYPDIDIYAYPDSRSKKLWFGGGATDITDVFTPGVHITVASIPAAAGVAAIHSAAAAYRAPHPTLRHELVHALTSRIAFHGIGFHPNMAITEGLAVALAPDANIFSVMSLDDAAAELFASGRSGNPARLFSPWTFWLESGPRAYTQAGSLMGWLARRADGIAAVTRLYAGNNWRDATGESAETLIALWQKEISLSSSMASSSASSSVASRAFGKLKNRVRASTLFRSRGVAMDVCPHSFAEQMAAGPDKESLESMAQISGDPAYHLMALRQLAHKAFHDQDLVGAKSLGEAIAADITATNTNGSAWPPRNEEDIEQRILAIDLLAFGGSKLKVNPDLTALVEFHALHPLPTHLARQIIVRHRLGQILPAAEAARWRWYMAGWAEIPEIPDAGKTPWLIHYLHLRHWLRSGVSPVKFTKINDLDDFIKTKIDNAVIAHEPAFAFEWYRSLAELLERQNQTARAHAMWLRAAAFVRGQNNQTVLDQMEQNARRTSGASVP